MICIIFMAWCKGEGQTSHFLQAGSLLLVNHCSCVCTVHFSTYLWCLWVVCKQWCYGCINAQVNHLMNAFLSFFFQNELWLSEDFGISWKKLHDMVCLMKWWETGPTSVFNAFCHAYGEQTVVLFFVPKCFLEKYFCSLRLGRTGKRSFSLVWHAVKLLGDMISAFCGFYFLKWQCAQFLLFWLYWVWFSLIWHLKSSLGLHR